MFLCGDLKKKNKILDEISVLESRFLCSTILVQVAYPVQKIIYAEISTPQGIVLKIVSAGIFLKKLFSHFSVFFLSKKKMWKVFKKKFFFKVL